MPFQCNIIMIELLKLVHWEKNVCIPLPQRHIQDRSYFFPKQYWIFVANT